jgi:DNA-binding CsgD family transcriptional regulator
MQWSDHPYVSPRDKQLLRRFAAGKTDRQIASELGGTVRSIAAQRQRIAQKFDIQTDDQLRELSGQIAVWHARSKQA